METQLDRRALSALGSRASAPEIAELMRISLERPNVVSLAAGFTDSRSLPGEEVRSIVESILSDPDMARSALQYGVTPGDQELRALTLERIRKADRTSGVVDSVSNSMITTGSQQFLYLTREALLDPGDILLVEDPTYFVILGLLANTGVAARGVATDSEGISLERLVATLERLRSEGDLSKVKALYLVTYCQNPSGRTTAFHRKKEALRILSEFEQDAGHPIYLIEDAAYRELRFGVDDPPSALSDSDHGHRVIYTGTYSKPFSTGLRVGFGVVPEELVSPILNLKANHDFGTPTFNQAIMKHALKTGVYDTYTSQLRERYSVKSEIMRGALSASFGDRARYEDPKGGLYYWVDLGASVETSMDSRFFRTALEKEALYVPGCLCYCDDPSRARPNREMRLSFGGAKDEDIPIGIERLAATLDDIRA